MTSTIRHWRQAGTGRGSLSFVTAPKPIPYAGEVLVKVKAVSLNYRDKLVLEGGVGLAPQEPIVPATDFAGIVEDVGDGVTVFRRGDRVVSTIAADWFDGAVPTPGLPLAPGFRSPAMPGALCEYVIRPAYALARSPDSLDDTETSTLPIAALTAWFALIERGRLRPGDSVLIHGTGGVALFGLQFAKLAGAMAVVVSSSADKLAAARQLGADHLLLRGTPDLAAEVRRLTGGRGADHVLETIGGSNFALSLDAAAPGGRVSLIGQISGTDLGGNGLHLARKRLVVEGIAVGHRRAYDEMLHAINVARLKPVIDSRFPLADLPAALDRLDAGPFGKIVIDVA
ncbi:MAG: Alcohol dehydrogenase zinc-binding domain protein [Proteobacteria bacterium]|nr:Alcohol dehydrogenase zinc-binding domain protein [Pseudomonadota bacterium]